MGDVGDILLGKTLGDYELRRVVGRGGMGVVFEARQISTMRGVAVKVPHEELSATEGYIRRFYQEAKIAMKIQHRNVVQTFEVGSDGIYHFIAMEFVTGRPLSMIIKKEVKLEVVKALKIARQTASALAAIHSEEIIHRDIKPKNLMVDETGSLKVMDFGIARWRKREQAEIETPANWVGTKYYLSPEQCLEQRADHRSDIYSLGVVLFEMLAGRVPFHADLKDDYIKLVTQQPVPEVRSFNPMIQDSVQLILDVAMAKKPEDRYSSAADMEQDILQTLKEIEKK